jgi:hypothetical protein
MMYYPVDGRPGYVHYTGRLDDNAEGLEAVDEWSLLTEKADKAFRDFAAKHEITLVPAVAAASVDDPAPAEIEPQTSSGPQTVSEPAAVPPAMADASGRIPYAALMLAGAILAVLAAGGFVLRRRSLAARSA